MSALRRLLALLARLVPFGILVSGKPRHFREMIKVLWDNRGRWGYAWRILEHGVCDGCSLGPRGLRDDVIPGTHLCLTRLKLLRLNTMQRIPDPVFGDLERLRGMSNEALHRLGRVPYPLHRRRGERGFSRISWDEAIAIASRAMAAAAPDRMGMFVTSRGLANETYYMAQKLARLAGTPHVDSCARLCHAASSVGLKETLGWAAATCSLHDWIGTELLVVIGSDLANNQPVSTKYMHFAKRAGTRIVVVNPFREPALERYWVPSLVGSALFGTKLMDEFFGVRPGGDIAFLSGALKHMDEAGLWDERFCAERVDGAEALRAHLRGLEWAVLAEEAGLPEAELRRFGELYGRAKTAIVVYSMGLTQYTFGVDNVRMVANLVLARGNVGRPKTGVMPIRGHSGVQGTAECGADADKLPGAVDITEESCARLEALWGHPIPRRRGLRAAHLLEEAGEDGLDVLYLLGGNHLETMPDKDYARRALSNVGLRIHQDIVLNTSTLLDADEVLVLPAETRYESAGGCTATTTERRIRFSPEIPGPRLPEARAEWRILAAIGAALPGRADAFAYADASALRAEMARAMPLYAGIDGLAREGQWVQWGGARLGEGGFPNLPGGKAQMRAVPLPRVVVPEGQFLLTSRRGKQFNSMAWGRRDPLTGGLDRDDVIFSPEDLAALGIAEGERVRVSSLTGSLTLRARSGPVRRKHAQAFWPECNPLLPRRYDPDSGEPDYSALVRIERA